MHRATLGRWSTACPVEWFRMGAVVGICVGVAFLTVLVSPAPCFQQDNRTETAWSVVPHYDVVSIRLVDPHARPPLSVRISNPTDEGVFSAENASVLGLIAAAFHVQPFEILNVPSWCSVTRFDVDARADDAISAQLRNLAPTDAANVKRAMLRSVLVDRFGFEYEERDREIPSYLLKVVPGRLHIGAPPRYTERAVSLPNGAIVFTPGGIVHFQEVTMDAFAQFLARRLNKPVENDTQLKATYTFDLRWDPSSDVPDASANPGAAPNDVDDSQLGESLFTATQEQLGLKLHSGGSRQLVVIVRRLEHPTPD